MPVRVRYAETDAQRVVYHANYLVYMEVARGAFTRAVGLPYQEIEDRGVHLVVAEAKLRYKASAGYDDRLPCCCASRSFGAVWCASSTASSTKRRGASW